MKIAVLSGKGGTGKTTISASLAAAVTPSQYIDCDVEEPNGFIFLNPEISHSIPVAVEIPTIDTEVCTGCGICADVCQYNALAAVKGKILVFPEICHSCGACYIVCKPKAMTPTKRVIGFIEKDEKGYFVQGKLNIGEPIAVPIIKELKNHIHSDMPVILDCPPGASCNVVQSLAGCDFCILVTEPTPFGLHDLKIAVSLVRALDFPFGIVINKAVKSNTLIQDYAKKEGLDILLEIPFSKDIARCYSKGILPTEENPDLKERFVKLYERIKERV